jgi:hypothetical protein
LSAFRFIVENLGSGALQVPLLNNNIVKMAGCNLDIRTDLSLGFESIKATFQERRFEDAVSTAAL